MLTENTVALYPELTEEEIVIRSIDLKYAEKITRAYAQTLLPTYEIPIEIVEADIWRGYGFVRIEYIFTSPNAYNPLNNWLVRVPFEFWTQKQAEIELSEYLESQSVAA
jgi:hypothetical protein